MSDEEMYSFSSVESNYAGEGLHTDGGSVSSDSSEPEPEDNEFVCKFCNNNFSSEYALRCHVVTHDTADLLDLDLKFRMYMFPKPAAGQVVLFQFMNERGEIELKEYNREKGMIADNLPYQEGSVEFGIVIPGEGTIRVSRIGLSAEQKERSGILYLKNKFLQSVLIAVAKDLKRDLKDIYRSSRWITYPQFKRQSFLDNHDIPPELRFAIFMKQRSMSYSSWRVRVPYILVGCTDEFAAFPWAICLITQATLVLQMAERALEMEERYQVRLSVHDLIDQAHPPHSQNQEDHYSCVRAFVDHGILEDGGHHRLRLRRYVVHKSSNFSRDQWESNLIRAYRKAPVSVLIVWFPSYNEKVAAEEDAVLEPLDEEIRDGPRPFELRYLLLTGHGRDECGRRFWELQNLSMGEIMNGDRGYVRLFRSTSSRSLVLAYVGMEAYSVFRL